MDELKQISVVQSDVTDDQSTLMEDHPMQPSQKSMLIPVTIMVGILTGLVTGFYVAQNQLLQAGGTSLLSPTNQELTSSTEIKVGDVFGSSDEKTFRDQADGVLMAGGIDGEGSHHLERGDNKSQWVYVTSSVVDLDLLVGDRVTIWGETNQGKKAGWLMDVGRLKVLELDAAEAPAAAGNQE